MLLANVASAITLSVVLIAMLIASPDQSASAAERLKLAPGISYHSDLGKQFPIIGDMMNDTSLATDRSTLIFFGAAGDLNTNRQAKRLVQLYNNNPAEARFVVINVDKPVDDTAVQLIKTYYRGYVPAQVLVAPNGEILWDAVGEVSRRKVQASVSKFN